MRTVLAVCLIALASSAAWSAPLREARSPNGRFELRIHPGKGKRPPQAMLLDREADAADADVWQKELPHAIGPDAAYVRDDGRYVVLLDDHRAGGARRAIAVIGSEGAVRHDFPLADVLCPADWAHVEVKRRAVLWRKDATERFSEDGRFFEVQLDWGTIITVELETGRLTNSGGPVGLGELSPELEAALDAADIEDVDGELAEVQDDPTPSEQRDQAFVNLMRSIHAERAALDQNSSPEAAARLDVLLQQAMEAFLSDRPEADANGLEDDPLADEPVISVQDVPLPDPASPVDYFAWVSQFTEVEDPRGLELMQAAIDSFTPWTGDYELLAAAMGGDADALASPEIQEWLETNAIARAQLVEATKLPYRGFPLEPNPDGLFASLLPHLAPTRDISNAILLEGRQLEAAGDIQAAIDRYIEVRRVGSHVGQGITLIDGLVALGLHRMADQAILDALSKAPADFDFAQAAEALRVAQRPIRALESSVAIELALHQDLLQRNVRHDPVTGNNYLNMQGLRLFTSLASPTPQSNWDSLKHMWAVSMTPPETLAENTRDIFQEAQNAMRGNTFSEAQHQLRELVGASSLSKPMPSALIPSFDRAHRQFVLGESHRRATQLAAEILAYRQRTGSLPTALDELGDEARIDPFIGEPFHYQPDGETFRLYSIGPDLNNDGGGAGEETSDVLFWPRTPKLPD